VKRAMAPSAAARQPAPQQTRRLPAGEDVRVVALEYAGADLWAAVSSDGEMARTRITTRSPLIVRWLPEVAAVGRPVFMIAPDVGGLALVAARGLGATVFAFEPDIPTLARLWENVLLNGCEGNLVPVPVAIGSKRALQEQRSAAAAPAAARYPGRRRVWREHAGSQRMVMQPCLAMPLDSVMKAWSLPAPHAIYVGPGVAIDEVVAGARQTLEREVTAVLVECGDAKATPAVAALTSAGFGVRDRGEQPEPASRQALWFTRS
jgi:hypothetical protein